MVLLRRIHKRNANIVVEANGEVLFLPTGDVGRWTNRFSQRVRAGAAEAAPSNKRPRWAHYGKPLKATMTASTTYHPSRMKVYSAVGSTAPHGYYVDQGTGVYAGRSPYRAKILPPWERGGPSLYEHTWRPPSGGTADRLANVWSRPPIRAVYIKGQKGQGFLDKGVTRGFASMRMRSFQVPGEGASGMSGALASFPDGLANFVGNTPADAAFLGQLEEWRAWRDEAFNAGRVLGRSHYTNNEHLRRRSRAATMAQARAERSQRLRTRRKLESARRTARYRAKNKPANDTSATKADDAAAKRLKAAKANDKAALKAAMLKRYGANFDPNSVELRGDKWYFLVKVGRSFEERSAKAKFLGQP